MTTTPDPRPVPPAAAPERDARRRHLRVAPDGSRDRRARLAVWAASAVTVLSLFTLVASHALAAQQAFDLDRLEAQRADAARRYERLRAEVATLSAPAAVVEAAQRLGLVFSDEAVEYIEAPPAAPDAPADAQTSQTLADALEAKSSLAP